jgi:hypothetical protein
MINQFLCWWYGHEWMPGYKIFQQPLRYSDDIPPDTPVVVRMTKELVDYKCRRCNKTIPRDEYDQWERRI